MAEQMGMDLEASKLQHCLADLVTQGANGLGATRRARKQSPVARWRLTDPLMYHFFKQLGALGGEARTPGRPCSSLLPQG